MKKSMAEKIRQDAYDSGYEDGQAALEPGQTERDPETRNRLVTSAELAEETAISERVWRLLRGLDAGPAHFELAGRTVYRLSDVDEYLADGERRHDEERDALCKVHDRFLELRQGCVSYVEDPA